MSKAIAEQITSKIFATDLTTSRPSEEYGVDLNIL